MAGSTPATSARSTTTASCGSVTAPRTSSSPAEKTSRRSRSALYAADPQIAEVVVVGLPHERWTEAITAFVVATPGSRIAPDDVKEALRGHLDSYKIPKSIIVVDELPKTSTGKIQKNVMRDLHREHYSS